jgi:2-hydroxy-6-oxonona-2,4-dienedioate hydrolase
MRAFFTDIDPDWNDYFRDALNAYRTDIRVPPLVQPKALQYVRCPVLVFGAEHDVNFPGPALIKRAKDLFPQAEVELLPGSQHCPAFTTAFRAKMAARIEKFLTSPVAAGRTNKYTHLRQEIL